MSELNTAPPPIPPPEIISPIIRIKEIKRMPESIVAPMPAPPDSRERITPDREDEITTVMIAPLPIKDSGSSVRRATAPTASIEISVITSITAPPISVLLKIP